jgi:polar amino acid transport system substrate-binding protein
MTSPVPDQARRELAPTGKLRAGINFSNLLLVKKDGADGAPRGVVIDVARELARRVGVPLEIVGFESPGAVAEAATTDAWDVAFIAADPARATHIEFTPAYVTIEATYLVRSDSPIRTQADIDRDGVRISVSDKSAYDLFLTRSLKHAQLVRSDGTENSFQRFVIDRLDAMAGLRGMLLDYAEGDAQYRLLDGSFTSAQQAIGTPRQRGAAASYLRDFVQDMKQSGFLAEVFRTQKARGLSIAP